MSSNINVTVHSSLPPNINKPDPYFYLHLHINYIKWINKISSNFEDIIVKVLWWGEETSGAIFVPRCVNLAGYKQSVRTHAIYPVCVPLNHFTTYLGDMSSLFLDIIDKNKHTVIGRASIDNLEQLGFNKGVQSLSAISNEANVKIGEIMIAMSLDPSENHRNRENPNTKPALLNGITQRGESPEPALNAIKIKSSIRSMPEPDPQKSEEKPDDLIDRLIEKSKMIRETISIDVKNDEINEAILKRTFPNIGDRTNGMQDTTKSWMDEIFVDELSVNDRSKINTESILKMSENLPTRNDWADNDRRTINLIAGTESFCSESGGDLDEKYRFLSRSEANLLKKLDKDVSSDDDPCKHDSIIEELFYKQPHQTNVVESEVTTLKNNYSNKETIPNVHNNNPGEKSKDFEIYQSLSQNNNFENKANDESLSMREEDDDQIENEDQKDFSANSFGQEWYRNISSVKVYLDMLWLNSSPQPSNKYGRSRSQSPNCSTDRERSRRSCDSASSINNSSTSFSVTKPPTQLFQLNSTCKYFIDYKFPANVVHDSYREKENLSMQASTTRVPVKLTGCNINNNAEPNGVKSLSLDHVAEFPVAFNDSSVIQKWWKGIVRFKLISQDTAKKETVVGVGVIPLRNVISTNNFYRLIPVRLPRNKFTKTKTRVVIGSLALRTAMSMSSVKISHVPERRSQLAVQTFPERKYPASSLSAKSTGHKLPKQSKSFFFPQNSPVKKTSQKYYAQMRNTSPLPMTSAKIPPICLESLLCVSSIRYVNFKSITDDYRQGARSCNLFFIGRLLWAPNHKITSRVLWGTSKISDNQPINELESFKLSEKSPLVLTSELLEKLKNNYAILEAWDTTTDKTKNTLYGLVKIPVNVFHMSFKNERIRHTVLNNVYPVLSCDDWINIEDPITGKSKGQVHVLLGLGSPQQIENLQLSKENTINGHWNRNYLTSTISNNELVEHSIELDIESLRNFYTGNYSESSLKESYFYVQYYFPLQNTISDNNGKNWESALFRSINNPVQVNVDIADTNRHKFRLPIDSSLKSMLSKHFDMLGKKHVLFELCIKQYNPFPSSKSVAKGRLPVISLFQLINQHSVDMDSVADTVTQQQVQIRLMVDDKGDSENTIGVLNIRMCYRTRLIQNVGKHPSSSNCSPSDQPIVRIEILSATGLQCAAQALVDTHPELQYPSVTGINSHIKFWLTDESNKQSRIYVNSKSIQKFQFNCTKTIPRTFLPKFDHICEVLLGPIIDDDNSHSLYKTLAEKIISGIYQLNVEVYHNVFNSLYCDFSDSSSTTKILIGKGRISLADLLLRSSGFMGPIWVPVFSPMDIDSSYGGCRLNWPQKRKFDALYSIEKRKSVGAVEIRLGFNDKSDRKAILQIAMDAGYVVPWTNRLETEDLVWQHMDIHGCIFKNITVNIEEVELSEKLLNSIFTPEAGFQKSSMKILTRYRMYKQPVSSSQNFLLNENEISERVFIPINHEQKYCYRVSSDLFRYLRESKLEIQVWAIYGSLNTGNMEYNYDQNDSPNDVRLLGSAQFDLSNLILPSDQQDKSVSHILPIWKRGVANCGNSNLTISAHICGATSPMVGYNSDNEENESFPAGSNNNQHLINGTNTSHRTRPDMQKSFPVHVIVEKAVNLKQIQSGTEANDLSYKPLNYFVSFACSEEAKSINSPIMKGQREIIWNFECDTRLPYNLLTDDKLTLDFKVYYSTTDSEQAGEIMDEKIPVGLVKLDLSLILKGFERVIGWYNIIDMQGDCQGQIKVGVTPLIPLVPNTAVVSKVNDFLVYQPSTNKPFTIEDHQSYLSSVQMRLRGPILDPHNNSSSINVDKQTSQEPDYQDMASKSFLFDTLKEKLKELDVMNETFKRKMEPVEKSKTIDVDPQKNQSMESCPTIVASKVDYGMNTEDDNCIYQNTNYNNNNCDNDFKYDEDDFEGDEEDQFQFSENESRTQTGHDRTTCINEFEPSDIPPGNMYVTAIQRNISPLTHQSNNCSNHESDCYSQSSCEIDHPQSDNSSRSISSCSSHNKLETEFDEILNIDQYLSKNAEEPNDKLNDSWDETLVQPLHQIRLEETRNTIDNNSQKKPKTTSIIPQFFPQSFDFNEKMKALKNNFNSCGNTINIASSSTDRKLSVTTQQEKKNPINNITDEEAKRISKIFGIKKS